MGSKEFPNFDGFTVEHDAEHHKLVWSKPMDGLPPFKGGAPREQLRGWVRYTPGDDLQIAYDQVKVDAYQAEMEFVPEDDKALIEERFNAAVKHSVGAMIDRLLDRPADQIDALLIAHVWTKLARHGFSPEEIQAIIGKAMATTAKE